MRKIAIALIVYVTACFAVLLIPASEGYDTLLWKLFAGQLYAVPVFILTCFLLFLLERKNGKASRV
ncbi:DUF4017 family protein [Alteribacter natronophilus]|uniref:DUF4017 family protein n=1 Tax=Alteribacter natronophilus TaxID=2583810 RepID=UPI00110F3330|nr:DUF4017 family protein [Alteribacter natronophilus]TMW73723.1 DUF4017 domain-containing protein [Alteribacter natronophilus]